MHLLQIIIVIGSLAPGIVPASAQHVITIPRPVSGWANTVNNAPPYTLITLGPGQYHTSVPITISRPGITIAGAGARATQIIADARMGWLVESSSREMGIRDVAINANHMAMTAIHMDHPTFPDTGVLNGVFASFAINDGIVLHDCQICTISGVSSYNNGGNGIVFAGCNACTAMGISAQRNGGFGIVIEPGEENGLHFSGGMTLIGPNAEANGRAQIAVQHTTTAVLIENPWIEGHSMETDGILIEAPQVTVLGGRISGPGGHGTAAIHLSGPGEDAIIVGNVQMENEKIMSTYARIAR